MNTCRQRQLILNSSIFDSLTEHVKRTRTHFLTATCSWSRKKNVREWERTRTDIYERASINKAYLLLIRIRWISFWQTGIWLGIPRQTRRTRPSQRWSRCFHDRLATELNSACKYHTKNKRIDFVLILESRNLHTYVFRLTEQEIPQIQEIRKIISYETSRKIAVSKR